MSLLGEALAALRGRRRNVPVEEPSAWSDDRALVGAIIDGSQAAFAQLVETHQRTCAHVIGRMVGDRDQVADLLQETFLAVFRQLHRFRFESSLRTWISRVAYTTALQHLRRRRLEAQWMVAVEVPEELGIGDEGPGPAELSEALQAGRQLGAALERLSAPQRLIVGLHYLEDFDLAEIEQVTGLARGTIKSHLHRARQVLKQELVKHATAGELL
ncbi:RNA polymerase sigma-70 factor, ECF subfamily [Stenotrophomonas sp. RIT309]|jgi:RNA polymerase sigma-70 factor (ECF subfamily)|uniref:RNA polymerase sigma-70 factor, ECF subfamily n=2 Tax=Stenotrophomonas indicatrix TaxID=2045451 RepID=A0A1W1GZ06_9GAMM|nr:MULTISPECIES: sigma-70 family RNA polymerase sigma factor [Stenotrophomonas]TPD98624.1 sigma-70 family RNA polymerase sigma factor [Stenotrophomonas maltophilia]EZP44406.1 RNA polymerase sigma-70 factor, ECF subfamily [Stenotrophomonas sp. RIT309]MCK6232548.1 sigma-70 family RNA polymerase sigma factor [Stenotrophomonas indicatrix]WGV53464.1 sigma-70 family RNA polymerase sigma factor [Stenotrophomonas indicatrix]SLM24518.1 RNA polymerase sigma-70 factor, ECF subfamily [Stenotrophomonas ind